MLKINTFKIEDFSKLIIFIVTWYKDKSRDYLEVSK